MIHAKFVHKFLLKMIWMEPETPTEPEKPTEIKAKSELMKL